MHSFDEKISVKTDRESLDIESNGEESEDSLALLSNPRTKHQKRARSTFRLLRSHLITILLLIVLGIQTIIIVRLKAQLHGQSLSSNGLSLKRSQKRTIYEPSKYTSHNQTEADEAWSSVLAGHGVVSISPTYASQHRLPSSVDLPDGTGNKLYVIEAYHAIHCAVTLRNHYVSLDRGVSGNWSRPHDDHCFDALRQYIMCNIDDTLLWTSGHRDAGHGQSKQCHDWDALRDWAEERSASYFDVEPGRGISHLRNYHGGDGLPIGSLS